MILTVHLRTGEPDRSGRYVRSDETRATGRRDAVEQRRPATSRRRRALGAALGVLVLAAVVAACVPDPPLLGSSPSPTSGAVPPFSHVAVVVLENESLESVLGPQGAAKAPYLNQLAADNGVADNYFAISHASLGNYLAMVSGQTPTWRHNIDCPFYDCIHGPSVKTIGDQVEASGRTWKAYMDGMVRNCQHGIPGEFDPYQFRLFGNTYATRHNPFVYFQSITDPPGRCESHDVPYPQLEIDRTAGALPDLSYIVPDLCNDGHDDECGLPAADRWASQELPKLLNDPAFRAGGVLFVTFDEGNAADTRGCCGTEPGGGKVAMIAVSPTYGKGPGTKAIQAANHYSLLRTIEDAWRLDLLGHAADPGVKPMTELFRNPDPGTELPEAPLPILLPVAFLVVGGLTIGWRRRRSMRPTA
jgi:hypothetical protein